MLMNIIDLYFTESLMGNESSIPVGSSHAKTTNDAQNIVDFPSDFNRIAIGMTNIL